MEIDAKSMQQQDDIFQNGELEEINGNINAEQELLEKTNDAPKRIIKKAKRLTKGQPSVSTNVIHNGHQPWQSSIVQDMKNSRKSRSGYGRGLPKKGGAGGKGTWGVPGTELFEESYCRDAHDPNYDSDSQDDIVVEQISPEITDNEFVKVVEPILLEYFEHGDTFEVLDVIRELNLGHLKPKVAELALNLALDRKACHKEMASVLISDLYGKALSYEDIAKGFDLVLSNLADLTLDAPDAPTVIGQFLARAVADDCLPPKYISAYKGKVECEHARSALTKADVLLSMKHGFVRLDNVWGTGGGIRPVRKLIKQMVLLLKEYLSSGDIAEATRCLRDLEVPHFHHELVYEAVVMMLEDTGERAADRLCKLLKSMSSAVVITPEQMAKGFKRVYMSMPDICLDVPAAYSLLERFADMLHKEGVLSSDLYKDVPQRGRKRFVSEGDGGRIKQTQ